MVDIRKQLGQLAVIVDKTGGLAERRAFKVVSEYIESLA